VQRGDLAIERQRRPSGRQAQHGSWTGRDEVGNAIAGDVLSLGARGCVIRSEGPLVVAIDQREKLATRSGRQVV